MKIQPKTLPCHPPHWKYDLPGTSEQPEKHPYWKELSPPPNNLDQNFIEFTRSMLMIRGLGVFVGILVFSANLIMLAFSIYMTFAPGRYADPSGLMIAGLITIAACWVFIPFIRLDIELPRDEPIRFNRLRRKVYFYQFKYDRIFFLSKKKWGVKPEVHAWDDLKAEACRVYAPGHGGLIENIVIAAHKPGTNEVIARYFFAHDIHNGEHYWAIARLFMQQGPDAMPEFENRPRNWNNDTEAGFPRRLAPKVNWPADIDLESRTAPTQENLNETSRPRGPSA
jgi:hypothetical protein